MKNLKLLAALLALTIGLAGCGGSSKGGNPASSASKNKLDGDGMTAPSTQEQDHEEPEDVTYMRLLAGEDEYRACVLYLGGSYEVTTDVQKVLDSQTDLRDLWGFVYDIPQDHWVVAPDGGCDLYCIFPQDSDLFTWASTYKGASFERRQAILKQFIKEVRVGRDYNIEIVLNVPLDEFEEFKRHAASAGRGKNQKNKSQNPQKVGRCTSNAGIVVLDKTAGETISIVPKNAAHAILRC